MFVKTLDDNNGYSPAKGGKSYMTLNLKVLIHET
jgi:hypothetical protein